MQQEGRARKLINFYHWGIKRDKNLENVEVDWKVDSRRRFQSMKSNVCVRRQLELQAIVLIHQTKLGDYFPIWADAHSIKA